MSRHARNAIAAIALNSALLIAQPAYASDSTTTTVALLPNARMAPLENLTIEKTKGVTLLKFGTLVVNVGDGPLEVHATRADTSTDDMTVVQRVFDSSGGYRDEVTAETTHYAGDGHDHWHLTRFLRATLEPLGKTPVASGNKIGYCLLDSKQFDAKLAGSPATKQYTGCGHADDTSVKMGISVGWGDWYPYNMKGQNIDITGLPLGDYRLRVLADPQLAFKETKEDDNETWVDIRLLRGSQLKILGSGGYAVTSS